MSNEGVNVYVLYSQPAIFDRCHEIYIRCQPFSGNCTWEVTITSSEKGTEEHRGVWVPKYVLFHRGVWVPRYVFFTVVSGYLHTLGWSLAAVEVGVTRGRL